MNGLASMMAGSTGEAVPPIESAGSGTGAMKDVGDLVEMLRRGITPEELIEAGIPAELVEAALDMLAQEMDIPKDRAGLAGMYTDQKPMMEA